MNDDKLNEIREELKTRRDELRVRLHLAKADLRDEWQNMEDKWETAQDRFEELVHGTEATAKEVRDVLKIIGEEIGQAYSRIRDRLETEEKNDEE